MQQLTDLLDRVAGVVATVDPSNRRALAHLHSQIQEVGQAAAGCFPAIPSVETEVEQAGQLVERIALAEVEDAGAALRQIAEFLTRVREAVALGPIEVPAPAQESSTPAAEPGPGAEATELQDEKPISADDLPLVQEFIAEAREHISVAEAEVLKLEGHEAGPGAINALFRSFHTIKGVAGFLNFRQIGALAHAAESLLDLARRGELKLDGPTVDLILEATDATKSLVGGLEQAARTSSAPPPHPGLNQLLARLESAARLKGAAVTDAQALHDEVSTPSRQGASTADQTIKVATHRLDALINMVGELVIAQSMVSQDVRNVAGAGQRLGRNVGHLGKITRELQELSMSMRMVPIRATFKKMARLVRDLARKSGKQIDLTFTGEETELDRNVVEALADPLVHMIRNAADHGIEPADERRQAGKPPSGRIELRASHQAGKIVIEIADDGRGLNRKKILGKAIQAGLIADGQDPSEQQVFELIFAAGLSTAEQVTEVSGRGVGMDVVRRNIESLRGRIDIRSEEGKGSTFTIQMPLTLAVIDALVIRVGPERYLVPITSVEQSLRPSPSQLFTVQERGEVCFFRGSLLPLVRLHRLFSVTPRTQDPSEALLVVVQDSQRRCCLLVDDLIDQQQVVIKNLGEGIGAVRGVSGGAILGDGSISLILDVPGILDLAGTGQAPRGHEAPTVDRGAHRSIA